MKIINAILRLLLGGLFMFSGIVKLIDPKGTAIKLEEYFLAFSTLSEHYMGCLGGFFEGLIPATLFLSVGLSALEVILGIAIILWFAPRKSLWVMFLLLVFFGFLTGYSSSCDPNNDIGVSCVTDCGCFGDFLKLKPIESFYKDIFLLLLTLPLLWMTYKRKEIDGLLSSNKLIVLVSTVLVLLFGVYNIINLPIVDFRPYETGNNLIEKRTDGTPAKNVYIMSKDGKEESFEEYPHEEGYKFVRVQEIEKETLPTAKDFYLYSEETGEDITEEILKGDFYYIVIKNIDDLGEEDISAVGQALDVVQKDNREKVIITGNSFETIRNKLGINDEIPLFNLDETVIKAMVRNYPSVLHINNGIIVSKDMIEDYLSEINE